MTEFREPSERYIWSCHEFLENAYKSDELISCFLDRKFLKTACIETIRLCNLSEKEYKQIIVLSDGEPTNPGPAETLSSVTGANWQRTPIHTVYLGSQTAARQFMQQLAAMNGGEYSQR